jgi:GT2 family glycosyltransferase
VDDKHHPLPGFRARLERSFGWQLVLQSRAILNRAAPAGSWRAKAVNRVLSPLTWFASQFPSAPPSQPDAPAAAPYKPKPVDPATIAFKAVSHPHLSIVIPVHNHLDSTLACLHALVANPPSLSFEVIVADDASTDSTPKVLGAIPNLVLLRQQENLGFLRNCKAAASHARGELLLLLNNDAEVCKGAIDAMVARIYGNSAIAIVGAKLIYPNGELQEAGGIIWRSGDGCNYGRGGDPTDFRYNTAREVDYCSGACLLVRRDFWIEVGGFDERYAPAYYEDTDLCFEARSRGRRVVYEPQAEVLHVEGVSHGNDIHGGGLKHHQVLNRRKFLQKWRGDLERHYPNATNYLLAARDQRRHGHVVVIDHRLPTPDQDSGSVRMCSLLSFLIDLGYAIHFVPSNMLSQQPYTRLLQDRDIEVAYGYHDPIEFVVGLGDVLSFVVVSRPNVGEQFVPALRRRLPHVPLLYDMVDSHARREHMRADRDGDPLIRKEAERFERIEAQMAASVDAVLAVSEHDAAYLRASAGSEGASRIHILPNIHQQRPEGPPYEKRQGLLFLGGYEHLPNVDAALFLATEILPLLRQRLGDVYLVLAGSKPTPQLLALACPNVRVMGWVPDLRPLFDEARVFVAPLRYGAGVKGKIGESMSWGLPTVTSSIGAEGLGAIDGTHLMVADTPDEFVARVTDLYSNQARWTAMAAAGRSFIEESFGIEVSRQRFTRILAEIGVQPAKY